MKRISLIMISVLISICACSTSSPKDTQLRNAAMLKNVSEVKESIAAGANVNSKDKNGWTALMFSCSLGCPECIKLIIDAGADVNAKNDDGKTALIVNSVLGGDPECAKILIDAKADVNIKDSKGATALAYAKYKNYTKCVELLTAAGAK